MVNWHDFNAVRGKDDRSSAKASKRDGIFFNALMDEFDLMEFNKDGPKFSFDNKQSPPCLSKLDRILVSVDWMEHFGAGTEKLLGFNESDHRVFSLQNAKRGSGAKPFWFKVCWLQVDSLVNSLETWWKGFSVKGYLGYVLSKKLKFIKEKVKDWDRLDGRVFKLETELLLLEEKEERVPLTQAEREAKHLANLNLHDALKLEEQF